MIHPLLHSRFFLSLAVCFGLALGAPGLWATPKYTDRETAMKLAEALDKGMYNGNLITSTFIQDAGVNGHYLRVVLDNNTSEDWTLDKLQQYARDERVRLRGNNILLFPSPNAGRFLVLDRARFIRSGLAAKVYVKTYQDPDPLVGQKIPFAIHTFNLAEVEGVTARDAFGYPIRYVVEMTNGRRDLLSNLDAYRVLEESALTTDLSEQEVQPYVLQEIKAHGLSDTDSSGVSRFGIEMVFNRSVNFTPSHFPFQLYEQPGGKKAKGNFTIEVIVPNAVNGGRLGTIKDLEYLHRIQMISRQNTPDRMYLQAYLTPDVLSIPPTVEVHGSSVLVTFFKVTDLGVLNKTERVEAELRRRQAEAGGLQLSQDELARVAQYREAFQKGRQLATQARESKDIAHTTRLYQEAMEQFTLAAANGVSDRDFSEAFQARSDIEARLPPLIVSEVRRILNGKGDINKAELTGLLETARKLSKDPYLRADADQLIEWLKK
ncbi:MAG: hypothetical protein OEV94_03240 [Deltaproteobacteria bacterium]|nr:hypothetical protein [Deltaproteobacteria bacterium]